MTSKLEKVVLVVPTYNRPAFLQRLLTYHSTSVGLQIVIGDGSDAAHLAENREIIAGFVKQGLDVIHYTPQLPSYVKPGLEGGYGYAERQVNGARLSSRPYVHVSADDDLTSREFLEDAAAFLDTHPNYGVVSGYIFSVASDPEKQQDKVAETFTPFRSTARPEERAIDRIGRNELVPLTVFEYACFRRNVYDAMGDAMMRIAEKAQEASDPTDSKITTFTLIYLYDVLSDQVSLALAKLHWLPRVQSARHIHGGNWGGQVRTEYKANLGDSFVAPNWPALAGICVDAVADALTKSEGFDRARARHIAEAGLAMRVGQRLFYEGKRRLASHEAKSDGLLTPAPTALRKLVRAIPGGRFAAHSLLRQYRKYLSPTPRLEKLPTDVAAILRFLETYQPSSRDANQVLG